MIICIPYHSRDYQLACRLASRIEKLGNVSDYTCLLIHEETISNVGVIEPLQRCFKSVQELVVKDVPIADWSAGTGDASAANEVWIQTAWYIHYKVKDYWLWLEPDCVPMHQNWAKDLREEYVKSKRRVMGAGVTPSNGVKRLSGVAIYPPSVCSCGSAALNSGKIPWDVAGAMEFLKQGHETKLIHHILRTSAEAPTFPTLNELRLIPEGTALFHPCKDGSLIDRLEEKEGGAVEAKPQSVIPTSDYMSRLADDKPKAPAPIDLLSLANEEIKALKARIGELEAIIKSMSELNEVKPAKKNVYKKTQRTPEQQQALNERMAKARAGRKK